jgi:putative oxidoreductase
MVDTGLLIGRLVFGTLMAAHGSQKLFGWFGGHGLAGTAAFFETIGFRPGRPLATVAAAAEVSSGLLVAVGLLGPIGPALMLSVMIVASSVHWGNGVFSMNNGVEVPLLYATAAVAFALIGPGAYSLDALLGPTAFWTPVMSWTALGIGAAGGVLNLLARQVPKPAAARG